MNHLHLIGGTLLLLASPSALAQTTFFIDFETDDQAGALVAGAVNLATNEPYRNLFAPGVGVRLSTNDPINKPLNLYNTEGTAGADNDLERNSSGTGQWAGGSDLGLIVNNVLIINTDTNLATPNDNGGGGEMTLNFDVGLVNFGFDFIDLDSAANGSITFLDVSSGIGRTVAFTNFENGAPAPFGRTGVSFGNRHANSVLDVSAADLGMVSFDQVNFVLSSSGGIGTIYGTTASPIPEPTSPAIMLVGCIGLLVLFRRR